MSTEKELVSVDAIAGEAERIYASEYKEKLEKEHFGWFAVIDVNSRQAYVGEYSDEAFDEAKRAEASGPLHLIRIGHDSAFRMGYLGSQFLGSPTAVSRRATR